MQNLFSLFIGAQVEIYNHIKRGRKSRDTVPIEYYKNLNRFELTGKKYLKDQNSLVKKTLNLNFKLLLELLLKIDKNI